MSTITANDAHPILTATLPDTASSPDNQPAPSAASVGVVPTAGILGDSSAPPNSAADAAASAPDYGPMLQACRSYFDSGATRPIAERKAALRRLADWIKNHDAEICEALHADLHKAPFESWAAEIGVVLDEIRNAINNLDEWAQSQKVHTGIKVAPSSGKVYPEPFGVVLIMSPWNYPFMLAIDPLVAAIAAGNCAVLKPSDYSHHVSEVIDNMVADVFDAGHVSVVKGGRVQNAGLLAQKFDLIFFTGSTAVAKVVLAAAAQHLTPVVLELGGKSPAIVDKTADISLAAKRIVWGKFLNAGQTCVAPDYVMVHEDVADHFVAELTAWIKHFYGANPLTNPDYPHLINDKAFNRVMGLIAADKVVIGGHGDPATRAIEPTVLAEVTWDDPVMGQEIFGPVLPVLTWHDQAQLIHELNERPHPLATYIFTQDKQAEADFLENLRFGGGCVNDVVVHVATELPFGGFGESGMGNYHGKFGFDTFSHFKAVLHRNRVDVPLRYPPYSNWKLQTIKLL